jgi:hypothetical protein
MKFLLSNLEFVMFVLCIFVGLIINSWGFRANSSSRGSSSGGGCDPSGGYDGGGCNGGGGDGGGGD